MATYARCGQTHNKHFTANLPENFEGRLRFDRIMVMSFVWVFWPTLYMSGSGPEDGSLNIALAGALDVDLGAGLVATA